MFYAIAALPPSTPIICPVIQELFLDKRKLAKFATSIPAPIHFIGCNFVIDSYILECDNGIYEVYSLKTKVIREKLKTENIRLKYSCCGSIHNFSKDLIIKKHGVDWLKCEKCNKLIGGHNENVHEMMLDEKDQKIDFSSYELEEYDYLPYDVMGSHFGYTFKIIR